ncbi:DinB family protein [Kordiimonas marina]|uniref:DinB family protein n=1 Tax=Kordiimonas marina TaxID=2872312 RepID=UPI001FF643C5|nr:DinB family protein [Kordiimonas marina]MCJ9430477.1 DinB family protein [Kordiimonas marina]
MTTLKSDLGVTAEFDRFTTLFDRLVTEARLWIEAAPPARLEWTPPTDGGIHFGSRLRHASIKTLYVHMAIADRFWIGTLKDCTDGATLQLPTDMNAFQAALSGDFIANCAALHDECMALLAAFSPAQLQRRITFAGDNTEWSVMGFLWATWGHRSYHLGNLDMLVRMLAGKAPDYFAFTPKQMA